MIIMDYNDNKTAQVFRAKYNLGWDSQPSIKIGEKQETKSLVVERCDGEIIFFDDYSYKAPEMLDKLGLVYQIRTSSRSIEKETINPEYCEGLKEIQKQLSSHESDLDCRGGGQYSYEIILETPTKLGSGKHIERRKKLESFLKDWNIDFEVECFTVHSDIVCKLA